jgi:hypothetical protein
MSITFLSILLLQSVPFLWFRNSLGRVPFTIIAWSSLAVLQGFLGGVWEEIPDLYTALALNALLLTYSFSILRKNTVRSANARLFLFASLGSFTYLFHEFLNFFGFKRLLQVLTWGYDSAGSLSLLLQVDACNTYLKNCTDSFSETFPASLSDYPQNYALSITSFLPGSFSYSLESIVNGYASIYLTSIILLWVVCVSFVQRYANRSKIVLAIFLPFVALFGYWSHVFGSGFLSYIFAAIIFFAGIIVVDASFNRNPKIGFIFFAIVLLNLWLTYQLLVLPLALPFFALIWMQFSVVTATKKLMILISMTVALITLGLLIMLSDPKVQGVSYISRILVDGGIQPIPLPLFMLSTVFGVIVTLKKRNEIGPFVSLTYLSTVLVAASLATYSFFEKGYVAYYPMKFMYLSMLFSLLLAMTALASPSKLFAHNRLNFTAKTSIFLVLWYSIQLSSPSGYPFSSVMMGSAYGYVKGVIEGVSNNRGMACSTAIIQGFEEKAKRSADLVLVVDQNGFNELDTRWINVLSRTWNDVTFSFELSATQNRNNLNAVISPNGKGFVVVQKNELDFSEFSTINPEFKIKTNC